MGAHTHPKGEWMFTYKYMHMKMDGMRRGTSSKSSSDIFDAGYVVSPDDMRMDMHMFSFMYAPTDNFTFMVMAEYLNKEMNLDVKPGMAANMINNGSTRAKTKSDGWGDTKLMGLFAMTDHASPHNFIIGMGLSVPTGSINQKDRTPAPGGPSRNYLPASMQLGSGTWDLLPSISYEYSWTQLSLGSQLSGIFRPGRNSREYSLGDQVNLKQWATYQLNDIISVNAGWGYQWQDYMGGKQEDILRTPPNPMLGDRTIPTAFSSNYGGHTMDAFAGIQLHGGEGIFEKQRLAFEVRAPFYEDLNGYQMETKYTATIAWSLEF